MALLQHWREVCNSARLTGTTDRVGGKVYNLQGLGGKLDRVSATPLPSKTQNSTCFLSGSGDLKENCKYLIYFYL